MLDVCFEKVQIPSLDIVYIRERLSIERRKKERKERRKKYTSKQNYQGDYNL